MSLIRTLAWQSSKRAYRAFEAATLAPEAAQERTWRATWQLLQRAPFWQQRRPGSDALSDFPITEYDDYKATLDADFARETSALSRQRTLFWALSSGTTGARKLFPISAIYRQQFQKTNLPLVHALLRRYPRFLNAPVLYFTGVHPAEISPAGVPVGYISNYNYRNVPWLLRRAYAFPNAALRDAETFAAFGPLYALATDLSAIFAIAPMRVTLFAETIAKERERLLRLLSGAAPLPAGLPPLAVSKQRLATIERAFAAPALDFTALWPSLQFVCCWKASGCGAQLHTLRPYLGAGLPIVDGNYSATEGWVNVPLGDPDGVGGPIHPGAVIVELLPLGESKREALLPIWRAEPGTDYEVVLSNLMGLVRYRLRDIVRCTGRFNASPVVEFVQKADAELVLGMIRVSEAQMLAAVDGVALPAKWSFGPAPGGDRLVLYVAGDWPEGHDATQRIDAALAALNPYYARDTRGGVLKPLSLVSLPVEHPLFARVEHAQSKPKSYVSVVPE